MTESVYHPICIATIVTEKAITSLLEIQGSGAYRDAHPWLVAKEIWQDSQNEQCHFPILFAAASDAKPVEFTHWSTILEIDVAELHKGAWESRCKFATLQPMNPIWAPIDSVFLKPSDEQKRRESIEGIRVSRVALDEHHIHPYAICETPIFISDSES